MANDKCNLIDHLLIAMSKSVSILAKIATYSGGSLISMDLLLGECLIARNEYRCQLEPQANKACALKVLPS